MSEEKLNEKLNEHIEDVENARECYEKAGDDKCHCHENVVVEETSCSCPAKNNSMGLAGFILSIVAYIFCWVPVINFIIWLLGIIFSSIGLKRKPKGLAIAGLCISLSALIIAIILIICAAVLGTGLALSNGLL